MDSPVFKTALNAPKVSTVNEQFRGELAGQKPQVDLDSAHIKNAMDAPKREENLQIRKGDANVEMVKGGEVHHC